MSRRAFAAASLLVASTAWGQMGCSRASQAGTIPDESGTLAQLSWTDITTAARAIAACSSRQEALEVARSYGFVDDTGQLNPSGAKNVKLSDGRIASTQIIGVYADTATAGGRAGLTFAITEALDQRGMNTDHVNTGGWEQSALRAWLASEGMALLPNEVAVSIIAVDKLTNNAGAADDASVVTVTSDQLWVPSLIELYSAADWFEGDQAWCNDIVNSEGQQYQRFSDGGITASSSLSGVGVLSTTYKGRPCEWWTRTPRPSDSVYFAGVYRDGTANAIGYLGGYGAGVIVCFCL
ncbi:DUF6273 domain-containing protein [Cryptobacterium curtum]|uniref:DUF6273 domain-containing protein n=1 Tax=Cryptobacterium curtum TaxID=84163 RepID=UPI0028D2EC2F|nr:DUF6273 domain-containing protein [Cryptobacterium curtum]